ncbi:MAG: T9SS type A sorting domain-containing protein, partial [Paludibacteraceae bacterium]|nr:T9SS type A sorting domain-containing protein [Paludibacteraceae bacterium]
YDSTLVYYDEHQVVSEVYYLTLDVNPVYNYTFYDTICDNQSYIENNFSYITPAAGHYDETQSLTTIHGCDSIVNLSLEVYPTYATHATDSVCYGDVYVGPGFVINSATLGVGRHQDTTVLQSIHSCDSVIYLDLTVLPVYDSVIVDTICYKEDYTSYGFNIIQPAMGDSFDTLFLSTINSCDSTVYLELHVKPSHDTIIDVAICHGEDYIDNGFEYIQPEVGTVRDTLWLTNMYGCDSAVMLDLKVYPTFDRVVVESICEGEDYNGNGFHIVAPSVGLHLDTLRLVSAHGCDSVVSLNLTVYPNFETVFDVEIVSGDDYIDNGFSYIQPRVGIYHDSLLYNSEHGCDSMVKLNLTVMPVPEVFIEDTVCQGVDYLLEGFVVLHGEPGIVHDTLFLTNMFGGDSTVYLTLTRLPEYDTVYTEFICYGESYTEHGFNIINPAVGTYIDTLRYESVLGCDSTEYLNLTVYPLMDSLVVAEICEGEDYIDNEFTVLHPSVGVHRDTLLVGDDYGCTMYYLELTVNPINYTFLMPQICEGNNYVNNGFNIIQPSAGMVYDTLFLTNDYGCDSTVYLALTVNPVYNTYYTDSICYGEDYDKYGFTILQPAVGVIEESYVLQTLNGCDSTFYLTLTVNPVHDTLITAQICYGDSYDDNGFSFINPEIGVYYDTLSLNNIFGCDSIVSLQLTVNPVFDTLFVDEICQGDDYTLHGFEIIQPAAGSYYDTLYLTTVSGCDSLVYLDLTINPSFKAYFEGELCYGENYNEHGFNIIKPEVGVHYDSLNLATIHGCDSTLYLTLTVNPVYETWYNAEICYGEDYSGYGFEFINPSVGLHKDTLFYQTVNGCDSLICMKLRVWPKFNRQINATICNGEDYDEYGFHFVNPPVGVTHDTLFLHSVHGCDSVVRLVLNVLPVFDFGYSEITGHENVYVSTNLQTGRYKYTIDPITYCNNYRWEIIGTGDWVVEPQGNVCFVVVTTPGTCTLRVIAENECSYTDREIEITGSFYGVEEYEMIEADVYPNPTKDVIIIESESIIKTTVLGLHGQKVKCDNFEGEDKVRIDVGDLPRGSYILLIETNSGRIFKNIIIER